MQCDILGTLLEHSSHWFVWFTVLRDYISVLIVTRVYLAV